MQIESRISSVSTDLVIQSEKGINNLYFAKLYKKNGDYLPSELTLNGIHFKITTTITENFTILEISNA